MKYLRLEMLEATRICLSEVSTAVAARQGDGALLLNAGSDGTANPGDTLVGTILVRVGHEGTGLAESANTALEGAAVLAVGPGASDNDTSVARVDSAADEVTLGGGPRARVVDLEGEAELLNQLADVERTTSGDAIGNGVRLGDGDVDALAAGTDDNRGHLHIPVDETLLAVNNKLIVGVAVTLAKCDVGVVHRDLSKTLASFEVVVVDLGSLGVDALNLQEKLPGSFSNDGSYRTQAKSVQLDVPKLLK